MDVHLKPLSDDLSRFVEKCGGVLSVGIYPVISG